MVRILHKIRGAPPMVREAGAASGSSRSLWSEVTRSQFGRYGLGAAFGAAGRRRAPIPDESLVEDILPEAAHRFPQRPATGRFETTWPPDGRGRVSPGKGRNSMDAVNKRAGDMYSGKTILITGGTGSLGHSLVQRFLLTDVRRIIIYSRDEFKQYHMEQKFAAHRARLRFFSAMCATAPVCTAPSRASTT